MTRHVCPRSSHNKTSGLSHGPKNAFTNSQYRSLYLTREHHTSPQVNLTKNGRRRELGELGISRNYNIQMKTKMKMEDMNQTEEEMSVTRWPRLISRNIYVCIVAFPYSSEPTNQSYSGLWEIFCSIYYFPGKKDRMKKEKEEREKNKWQQQP